MNRKYILISFVFFSIILFSINASSLLFDGCCFKDFANNCYETNRTDCDENGVEFFDGERCADVDECLNVCCCEAKNAGSGIYPVKKGTCIMEGIGGSPIYTPLTWKECNSTCSQVDVNLPSCKESCKINEQNCVGIMGRIVDIENEGMFYCWENNQTYLTWDSCQGSCDFITQCGEGPITQPCYCGMYLYSSGFCCWDNSYTSDVTGSNCPVADVCRGHSEEGVSYECCDACLDENTYTEGNYDGSGNKCQIDEPNCCKECAPTLTDCCKFDWQCNSPSTDYVYSSCLSGAPCNEGCIEPECIPNKRINGGNNSYPMCLCGGEYYNTSTDSMYCCSEGPSSLSCESNAFSLEGYVYDNKTKDKIQNAYVIIDIPPRKYWANTDGDGNYFIDDIDLCFSQYFDVWVIKKGYYPRKISIGCPSQPISLENQNFGIVPIKDICIDSNLPLVDSFEAKAVKGKKEVQLIWEPPESAPSEIMGYILSRGQGSYIDQDFGLGDFFTTELSFVDDEVEWDSTYTYYVAVIYASGETSAETSVSIPMGDEECEGIFNDNEFCSGNKKLKCDADNNLAQTDCPSGFICHGPKENGKAECVKEINCKENGKPFGLFCTGASCLDSSLSCYYDYSDTIVDECNNCSDITDCYGYMSEDACLDDSCITAGANKDDYPCKWHYTFEELGKGFCYDDSYEGADHCSLCNKDSGVFYNSNCYQSVCTKLGSCYSKELSCEACLLGTTTCEDFDNRDSCINAHLLGGRNRTIDGVTGEIIMSDDACSLGACKWGDPDGDGNAECFKDANDDNLADCVKGEDGCSDFEPFNTEPQPNIPRMGAKGYGITFILEDGGDGYLSNFYFCIDKDNSCYPNKPVQNIDDNTNQVIINPLNKTNIITETGNYFIRYFSVDSNMNVEMVKSTEFFADPIPPLITYNYRFYNEDIHYYTEILLTSNECISCEYELNSIPPDKVGENNFNSSGNEFFIVLNDLIEGDYTFTTICSDYAGNIVRNNLSFKVIDTEPIGLRLDPDVPNGKTFYSSPFDLTGFTKPGILVEAFICDINCLECKQVSIAYGAPKLEPKGGFANKSISKLVLNKDSTPAEGNINLVWNGNLGKYINKSDYLRFSNHDTFYQVTAVYSGQQSGNKLVTRLDINPPLQKSISDKDTVSAYSTNVLDGWFKLYNIDLNVGKNCIVVEGKRKETGNTAEPISIKDVTYDPTGLVITQKEPTSTLFDSSLHIEVTTNLAADCTISNPEENRVAKPFVYSLAPSADKKTHSITFDSSYCISSGGQGKFCYLNNDASTSGGVYHKYNVNCTPDGTEAAPASTKVCFKVRTWYKMGETQYGLNVCNDAKGSCSGDFIYSCIECTPTCAGKECGSDGCWRSCGNCNPGTTKCVNYKCEPCTRNCEGKECGDDNCGGSCGSCGEMACVEDKCRSLVSGVPK